MIKIISKKVYDLMQKEIQSLRALLWYEEKKSRELQAELNRAHARIKKLTQHTEVK